MYVSQWILIAAIAYFLGSIPFGIVLAKLFKLPDPRTIGSGNIGATNMLRTGNKKVALLTLLLDASKGIIAVLITSHFISNHPSNLCFALLLATMGHIFSIWLKFTGGKGVATLLGGLFAVNLYLGAFTALVWINFFLLKRIVSLASLAAFAFTPVFALALLDSQAAVVLGLAAGLGIWKHRTNIRRIIKDEEPRIRLRRGSDT